MAKTASTGGPAPGPARTLAPTPELRIRYQSPGALVAAARRLRRAGKTQCAVLDANIVRFGFVAPILVGPSNEIIDGHQLVEAAKRLELERVPTVCIEHLNEAEISALRISLNRISELGEWDPLALKLEFKHLFEVDPSLITFTGYEMPKIDLIMAATDSADPDELPIPPAADQVVSQLGDRWVFPGGEVIYCGNARDPAAYAAALGGRLVQMVLSDIPYGIVPIEGVVSRRHGEFLDGSGLDEAGALDLFESFLGAMLPHVENGAIVDLFTDHRAMYALTKAIRSAGLQHLCTCVWNKGVGGMGGLYRHQAEFVLVTKWGDRPTINNIALGKHGRNRTTVWEAPGMAGFGAGRAEALAAHPTVKPVSLLMDAILDTSRPGGVILDPFLGSGSLLLAAHRTRRVGIGIELDPKFVDVAVRRMEAFTGAEARAGEAGPTFAEVAEQRRSADAVGAAPPPAAAGVAPTRQRRRSA